MALNLDKLTFGRPTSEFGTNADSLHEGGWINVHVPVAADGRKVGMAAIGCWVWTSHQTGGASAAVHDEAVRWGVSYDDYCGNDRHMAWADGVDEDEIAAALGLDEDDDLEDAILDAARDAAAVDYDEIFAAVLRGSVESKLAHASVRELVDALATIEG